jgi:RNA polymerase sigma-70 factor (ECF subfamily)
VTEPERDAPAIAGAISAVRAGDRDAFGVIVAHYQRRMFGLALMMTRDASGAEEVAQDALVRAYQRLHLYDARRPFSPWIATVTARLAQNWLVKRARVTTREGDGIDAERQAADDAADPLDELIADEEDRRLWRAVSALPSGQRTVVMLHYRQGLRVQDIAGALGVTAGTVKTLLFRARQRLRRALVGSPADSREKS